MTKAAVFLVVALACVANALTEAEYQQNFLSWMREYKKSYHNTEFQHRYQIFKKNLDYVNDWNSRKLPSTLKMNLFADLNSKEFSKLFKAALPPKPVTESRYEPTIPGAYPVSKNWTALGYVVPVGNQMQCGSCWAFSALDTVSACQKRSSGNLVALSKQQIMDCDTNNFGCNGGWMTLAYDYIISNHGVDTEASYPYTGEDGTTCKFNPKTVGATLQSYVNITAGSEADLQAKVNIGPAAVAIDASQVSFQLYSSGIYSDPNCSNVNVDHTLAAVGWGVDEKGNEFWDCKNQWTTNWGMWGFVRIARNQNNMCGIADMGSLALQCGK